MLAPKRVIEDWRRVLLTGLGLVSPSAAAWIFERQSAKRLERLRMDQAWLQRLGES